MNNGTFQFTGPSQPPPTPQASAMGGSPASPPPIDPALMGSPPPSGPSPNWPATSSPPPLVISPLFVDHLGAKLRLEKEQIENLHLMVELGSMPPAPLGKADLSCRILAMAATYQEAAAQRRREREQFQGDSFSAADLLAIMKELKIRLDENFVLTKTQKKWVRTIAADEMYRAGRISFKNTATDVLRRLTRDVEKYKLTNVIGDATRELVLVRDIKRQSSSLRCNWKEVTVKAVLESVPRVSLEVYTSQTAHKYMLGGLTKDVPHTVTVRNALLRRFVFENPKAVEGIEAEEDEDEDEDLDPAEENSESSDRPPKRAGDGTIKSGGKKHVGRVANGQDFWGRVDAWFAKEAATRGRDLTSENWRTYVEETLALDRADFATSNVTPSYNAASPQAPTQTTQRTSGVSGAEGHDAHQASPQSSGARSGSTLLAYL